MVNSTTMLPSFEIVDSNPSPPTSTIPKSPEAPAHWRKKLEVRLSGRGGLQYVTGLTNHLKNVFSKNAEQPDQTLQRAMRDSVLKQAGWGPLSDLLACQ